MAKPDVNSIPQIGFAVYEVLDLQDQAAYPADEASKPKKPCQYVK
jgi:hypothetical protein